MKKLTKVISLLLTICMLVSLFAACAPNTAAPENNTNDNTNPSTSTAQTNNTDDNAAPVKDTLIAVNNSEVQSCDPAATTARPTFQCLSQMLENLVEMDENGEYVMHLAESVEQVDDVTYLVHLRQGVKFHNGEEMKASDVVFTYARALESAKAISNLSELDPEGLAEIDEYTVQFKTKEKIATFLNVLTRNNGMILNKKAVEEAGDEVGRSCIGTGPYKFVEWQTGVQITMDAFEDYWGEKASIPHVIYKFVDDANSRMVMLEAGEADLIYSVPTSGIDVLAGNDKVVVHEQPSNVVRWFFINTNVEPTNNIDVRKAIAYALDMPGLTAAVFGTHAMPATSFLAPNIPGHTTDLETYDYNVEKAKEHLAAAGYNAGELTLTLTMWSQTVQNTMAQIIQAQLDAIGINVKIDALESAAFSSALATGEIQIGLATNSNTSRDPGAAAKVFLSTNFPKPNYAGLNLPEVDELLAQGIACMDEAEREQIYVKVQQLAAEECCIIPICYENDIFAVSSSLKGFYITKSGTEKFADYSF